MKRVIVLLVMVFAMAVSCYGQDVADVIYSTTVRNNLATHLDTLIPTYTIRPNVSKLVGYDCITLAPTGANTETWVSIFDSTDSLMTAECFGEQEGTGGYESIHDRWWRGKKVFNGVAIRQGAFTELQLYFRNK